uniref:Uncharacterized protein n=1 Tax=viral metagenome TaxID=1070528 RepID=A0A6M3X6H8_9ZZZZ
MGYALMFGKCCACGGLTSFNPVKVPSVRINGTKEPVCKFCIEDANKKRKEMGLETFNVPEDAYEPCNEMEL